MLIKDKKYKLLIVCRANITRSIYISGYMKKLIKEKYNNYQNNIYISSAGIEARKGSPPNNVIRHVAQLNNFNVNRCKSKLLTQNIINKADVILTMENKHTDFILNNFKLKNNKIYKITEYLSVPIEVKSFDVADPTGKETSDYKEFIELAHIESKRILSSLIN